jgi:hypothetical protein
MQEECRALEQAMPQATDSAELLRQRKRYTQLRCK